MSPHDFATAVTGLSGIKVDAEVRGLDVVGKKKVVESRSALCPLNSYDKSTLQAWLLDNCQEEGWTIDPYLGSQSSLSYHTEGVTLNYRVYKYVEA
jgi:hypothetical protein